MPQALEGSQAIARAVALCRPQVVAAYPITPQTHIVEHIAKLVADGELHCEVVSVESEFSAASVVLGSACAGSRAYTATASQGLLLMSEVLYNISGLRVPLVLTCANRALSAPLSIWNDQQDSMAVRDAGWVQLYCADNQEAVDTTIQAFRIAERCELPVMVCVDGFALTHTLEPLELPSAETVAHFLPPYRFSRTLDPLAPLTMGTLVAPEYFTEARHLHHAALLAAEKEIVAAASDWGAASGREHAPLVRVEDVPKARIGILTLGSVFGTLLDARDQLPDPPVRLLHLRCFRPFPVEALRAACAGLSDLVVLERAIAPGADGIIGAEVRSALMDMDAPPRIHNFAAGLGGRDVPLAIYPRLIEAIGRPHARMSPIDIKPELLPENAPSPIKVPS